MRKSNDAAVIIVHAVARRKLVATRRSSSKERWRLCYLMEEMISSSLMEKEEGVGNLCT